LVEIHPNKQEISKKSASKTRKVRAIEGSQELDDNGMAPPMPKKFAAAILAVGRGLRLRLAPKDP